MRTGSHPGTLGSEVAILENNFALADMPVNTPAKEEERTPGWMGIDKTAEEAQDKDTFVLGLGWDFETVWDWDETSHRPVLK